MARTRERLGLDQRLLDAIVFSIGKTVTDTFAQAAEIFAQEAGRNFLDYVRRHEGVDLVKKTPLETVNSVCAYFVERGFFEDARAEMKGARMLLRERKPAHVEALREMLRDPTVKVEYCPACLVIRHLLKERFNLAVDEVGTRFEEPGTIVYEMRLSPWETKEPEAAFAYG